MGFNSGFKRVKETYNSGLGYAMFLHKTVCLPNLSSNLTKLLTYLLTPLCSVLFEKLTDPQLVKKFPTFYGTRRFITSFTRGRHLSLM